MPDSFSDCFAKSLACHQASDHRGCQRWAETAMPATNNGSEIAKVYRLMAINLREAGADSIQFGRQIENRYVLPPMRGPLVRADTIELLQQATLWADQAGDAGEAMKAILEAACHYMESGAFRFAEDFFTDCATRARNAGDRSTFADCMGELGRIGRAVGSARDALKYTWNSYSLYARENSAKQAFARSELHEIERDLGPAEYARLLADIQREPALW